MEEGNFYYAKWQLKLLRFVIFLREQKKNILFCNCFKGIYKNVYPTNLRWGVKSWDKFNTQGKLAIYSVFHSL